MDGPVQKKSPVEGGPDAHYDIHYALHVSEASAAVRREAYGEDIGQQSWLTADDLRRFIAWLELTPTAHVLDVGSGGGGPSLFIAATVRCRVSGVDINEHGVAMANRMAHERGLAQYVHFQIGDASTTLPFPDETFDALLCVDAINHLPDRSRVIAEWHRVLRRGGRLLFTDPITVTGILANDEIAIRSSIGYFLFTPEGVNERILLSAGFQLIRRDDATESVAILAQQLCAARDRHREELVRIEGLEMFERTQRLREMAWRLAAERRLSRYVFLARKL